MNREVGMYVRYKPLLSSKYVKINKIKEIEEKENCLHIWLEDKDLITEKYLIKASYNIIDILEVGDIISFYEDIDNYKKQYVIGIPDLITLDNIKDKITNDDIRLVSILTKEQMEQMAYEVEE